MNRKSRSKRRQSRKAFTLLVALLCCLIAGLLVASIMQKLAVGGAQLRLRTKRIQTVQLAEAGIQLALLRIASDREYSGETWTVSSQDMAKAADDSAAHVNITVAGEEVTVTAIFPADAVHRHSVTRTVSFSAPKAAKPSKAQDEANR